MWNVEGATGCGLWGSASSFKAQHGHFCPWVCKEEPRTSHLHLCLLLAQTRGSLCLWTLRFAGREKWEKTTFATERLDWARCHHGRRRVGPPLAHFSQESIATFCHWSILLLTGSPLLISAPEVQLAFQVFGP